MSTKCTLALGEAFHFYREALDDDNVYLQIESTEYEANHGGVTVQVPIHIWETIRHVGGPTLDLVDKSDEDLLAKTQADVDRRIDDLHKIMREHPARASLALVAGSLIYGRADRPREQQIEKGFEYYRRERQRQRKVKVTIAELREMAPVGHLKTLDSRTQIAQKLSRTGGMATESR
jgi:hypothetical protein